MGTATERPLLMTVAEAARHAGIGQKTMMLLVKRGHLRHLKIGRVHKVPRRDVEAFVERQAACASETGPVTPLPTATTPGG